MTTETETKPVEQQEEKKEEAKVEVKKEIEEETKNEEKSDDKAEKPDKEKKDEDKKKDEKATSKKEAPVPKPTVHKVDYEKDIVYLYQFTRTPVLPSLSPYCLKVETWLRLAGLKYENVDHKMKYKSKKGQLPFIEVNGEEIADSAFIIRELGLKYNTNLDSCLTPQQRNIAHANISMIENHFAWVVKSFLSKNPDSMVQGFKLDIQHLTGKPFPAFILNFFFKRFMKTAAKKVRAHGIGVHKPEEIEELGHNDLKVLSDLLGEKLFFFGEEPTTLDVVAFSNLVQVVFMDKDVSYSLRDWMSENCSNLVDFCNRLKERAFPDWDEMCKNLDLNSHLPKPPKEEEKEEEKKVVADVEKKEADKKETEEDKKDEKEKDDSEKEKLQKDEKEGEKEDNKKTEEKEKDKAK